MDSVHYIASWESLPAKGKQQTTKKENHNNYYLYTLTPLKSLKWGCFFPITLKSISLRKG
ncbi:hypothetical protein SMI01S_37910 [Sphingobacterium mizutaii NBRC 14946 = DSM 11724]|uniref:Uncharacterized protein n=1 Tax=Sphingobacterium mizutaii NBRC 14946 = DSM 11724 TaxID=1220576 RepID=A0ABQ0W8E3_9SPHI|nr:hypothetical protein SMI01S_37910 [Sphingobacterium mizutaii NBRC 14946 = DSM 11724]